MGSFIVGVTWVHSHLVDGHSSGVAVSFLSEGMRSPLWVYLSALWQGPGPPNVQDESARSSGTGNAASADASPIARQVRVSAGKTTITSSLVLRRCRYNSNASSGCSVCPKGLPGGPCTTVSSPRMSREERATRGPDKRGSEAMKPSHGIVHPRTIISQLRLSVPALPPGEYSEEREVGDSGRCATCHEARHAGEGQGRGDDARGLAGERRYSRWKIPRARLRHAMCVSDVGYNNVTSWDIARSADLPPRERGRKEREATARS